MRTKLPPRTKPGTQSTDPVAAQLGHLETKLNRLRGQVRQAQQLASLGIAAATIAHEVNNLLTPILNYADAALNADDDQLRTKALIVTLRNTKMLVGMAERILKISAAKEPKRLSVPIRKVVEEAVESLCRDLSKDSITLANEIDETLTVWADPLQIQQVFFNLFLNAREAMAKQHGGRLTITARRDGDQVVIEVRDTGGGIPKDLVAHVFDPLQSSKSTGSAGPIRCKGLGLALCRDLIDENGGTIRVVSKAGESTTFTINLPAANEGRHGDT